MDTPVRKCLSWIELFFSQESYRMDNIFYPDFREFLIALNTQKVRYLLVGGYAVIFQGYSRTTGDMDI